MSQFCNYGYNIRNPSTLRHYSSRYFCIGKKNE